VSFFNNGDVVIADVDVDAPDLHIVLKPEIYEERDFISGNSKMEIISEKCIRCGLCRDVCRFDAISEDFVINEYLCEGCGFCVEVCPADAIKTYREKSGRIFIGDTRFGKMVYALLNPSEENSGKLVAEVKKIAKEIAEKEGKKYIVLDGPPGIGCPVISSLSGADLVILITEPNKSAFEDLKRIYELVKFNKIKSFLVINKWDLSPDISRVIEEFALREGIEVLGKIPFSELFIESLYRREVLKEYNPSSEILDIFKEIYSKLTI